MLLPAIAPLAWTPSYRLIPSRFPPVTLFDRVADPADLDAVFFVENLTNLDAIPSDVFELVATPLRIAGRDGSPVRALAILDQF